MSTAESWWRKPFPNFWVSLGAVGSMIFGLSLFLRWVDGSDSYDYLMMWAAMTAVSMFVLAGGVLLARRSGSTSVGGE